MIAMPPTTVSIPVRRNGPKVSPTSTVQGTFGRRTNGHGAAAMAKRIAVISAGESSSSANLLATNPRPQMTATRTARKTSKGFTDAALALLAGFRFPQQIGAVQRRVIIGRDQRETDVGQHTLHHPAKRRIFGAHMGHHTVARNIVVLDVEVRPRLDAALGAIRHADVNDVAQVKIRAGL